MDDKYVYYTDATDDHVDYRVELDSIVDDNNRRNGNLSFSNDFAHCRSIMYSCNTSKVIRDRLALGMDPGMYNSYPIYVAAKRGYWDLVETLLDDPRVDPSAGSNRLLRVCMKLDAPPLHILKRLLSDPRIDPSKIGPDPRYDKECFCKMKKKKYGDYLDRGTMCVHHGGDYNIFKLAVMTQYQSFEILRLLLENPRLDPSVNDNEAVRYAARRGDIYASTLKLLLKHPKVDPTARDNEAIRYASRNDYITNIELLLCNPKVREYAETYLRGIPNIEEAIFRRHQRMQYTGSIRVMSGCGIDIDGYDYSGASVVIE